MRSSATGSLEILDSVAWARQLCPPLGVSTKMGGGIHPTCGPAALKGRLTTLSLPPRRPALAEAVDLSAHNDAPRL